MNNIIYIYTNLINIKNKLILLVALYQTDYLRINFIPNAPTNHTKAHNH